MFDKHFYCTEKLYIKHSFLTGYNVHPVNVFLSWLHIFLGYTFLYCKSTEKLYIKHSLNHYL